MDNLSLMLKTQRPVKIFKNILREYILICYWVNFDFLTGSFYEKYWNGHGIVIEWDMYRPQRSWGKVMFLHVSVILFTGGSAPLHAWVHPPPWADTLWDQATSPPPPPPAQCMWGDMGNKRAVRILLDAILFKKWYHHSAEWVTSSRLFAWYEWATHLWH